MFQGIKVLELASVLAGPSVGQFFAELGAEVVKVENTRTGGDVTRSWKSVNERTDDRSAYFCSVNWGKRSIAVDLTSVEGRDIVYKLVKRSAIVIASYKPGDAGRLGVGYETLRALNPAIIYGQVTGYGNDVPRVGYDAVIQAEAGFMFMNGEPGGASLKMPVALIDVLAAHQLKEALLLSWIHYLQTGKGGYVEVSLFQAAVSALVNQATNWLVAGNLPKKQGSAHPNIAPYGDTFRTSDGMELLLAVGSDRQFIDLCKLLEIGEVAESPEFYTNPLRVQHRDILNRILGERIAQIDSPSLITKLHHASIPAGMIQNLEQVFQTEKARQLVIESGQIAGLRTYVGSFPRPENSLLPPPRFGEHTQMILHELGH
jgi:crotonobetainyl-CoA:carnitine CoA-transferase CaiB-like acyl-CoA transferase